MRAPNFWNRPPRHRNYRAAMLSPLAMLYASATARRLRTTCGIKLDIPVVCIGNINAGGTGKTPTVMWLQEQLIAMGARPHVVSRGYGGELSGPVQVSPHLHNARDVGDEPLLLSAFGPVWVAKDRAAGAIAARNAGATVILLDDGFQNPSVQKDLSIIVVDAKQGFGNTKCMPAGPLREPVKVGLRRADFVLSLGSEHAQTGFLEHWGTQLNDVPHITGKVCPLQTGMPWQGTRVLAFAGIGHPEKFFATLRASGADIVHGEALADHQPLTLALMSRLEKDANRLNAQLVTTEKDAVRLPEQFRRQVITLPVRLSVNQADRLRDPLATLLNM